MTSTAPNPTRSSVRSMAHNNACRKSRTRPITPGETVYLDGNALVNNCTRGAITSYAWSFVSIPEGSRATLFNANQCRASFIPDIGGRYLFCLEASVASGALRVVKEVRVGLDDLTPVAVAKAESVLVMTGAPIRLSGGASENPLSDPIHYEWRITAAPEGSIATLSYAASESPMIFPDRDGRYEISLSVRNTVGAGTTDKVVVHVVSPESLAEVTLVSKRNTSGGINFGRTYTAAELSALKRAVKVSVAPPVRKVEARPALQPETERVVLKNDRAGAPAPQRFQSLIRHIRVLLHDGAESLSRPAETVPAFQHPTASRR